MRVRIAGLVSLALVACDVDFAQKPIADPGLERRIAQKRAEIAADPNDGSKYVTLGDLYLEAERYFEAAEAYKTAEDRGAKKLPVHAGLSLTYLRLGFYEPAIKNLKECFRIDRTRPLCLFALGQLLEQNGTEQSLDEARAAYSHFIANAPNHEKAPYVRSAIDQINLRIGPPKEGASSQPASQPGEPAPPPKAPPAPPPAEEEAAKGPEAIPGHGGGEKPEDVGELNPYGQAIQRALAASRKNDIPAAQKAYAEALKIRPDDPSAQAGLAETHFAQGQVEKAVALIGKTYDAHPEDPQVRWIFGLVMLRAGQRQKEAFQAWESLVKEFPDIAKQLGIPQRIEAAKKMMGKQP